MATVPILPLAPAFAPPSLRLPDLNRDAWTRDANAMVFPDYHDLKAWTAFRRASINLALRHLPEHFTEALDEFFSPVGIPALMFENFPVDPELPPSPADGMRPRNKQAVSEAVISGI